MRAKTRFRVAHKKPFISLTLIYAKLVELNAKIDSLGGLKAPKKVCAGRGPESLFVA